VGLQVAAVQRWEAVVEVVAAEVEEAVVEEEEVVEEEVVAEEVAHKMLGRAIPLMMP
jgi:hypothetical protein